ncbi:hypothetical protein [Streptomyces griseofuscus]|uniref:hypothetical protein n=1 Tax=Streptomyces griseofuscus TaxID=146922 RepID=UPI0034551189
MAETLGDVGPAVETEGAEGKVTQAGHGAGCGASADAGGIRFERHAADTVFLGFDPPVPSYAFRELSGLFMEGVQAGEGIGAVDRGLTVADGAADDLEGLRRVREGSRAIAAVLSRRISLRPRNVSRLR